MAELTTLARPYAKAAFEYAKQQSQLADWSSALVDLAAIASDERVAQKLSDPSLTADQQAELMLGLLGEDSPATSNYVKNLASNKRLTLLNEISQLFELMKAQFEQSVEVEVISAQSLSEEQTTQLSTALAKHLERQVSLQTDVDPSLIGGAIVRAGDAVIDGTVRGRLNRMAEATNS